MGKLRRLKNLRRVLRGTHRELQPPAWRGPGIVEDLAKDPGFRVGMSVTGPPEAFGLPPDPPGLPPARRSVVTAVDPERGVITLSAIDEDPAGVDPPLPF